MHIQKLVSMSTLWEVFGVPVPFLSATRLQLVDPDALMLFPSVLLICLTLVNFVGFSVCCPPIAVKDFRRTISEDFFIFNSSAISAVLNIVSLITANQLPALTAFAIEISVSIFEAIYLSNNRRLSVESMVHHVCTPVAILCSLTRKGVDFRILAQLSLVTMLSNMAISGCKIMYLKNFIQNSSGLTISLVACIAWRLSAPSVLVTALIVEIMVDPGKPGWTRIYVTSLLMLLYLNGHLTYGIYQRRRRALNAKNNL